MRQAAVEVRRKKHFKVTTDNRHNSPVALNLLNRKFEVSAPNRVWAADLTYLWTEEGWLYLAVVLDLFSRRVVGWSLSGQMKVELVKDALRMAVSIRKPPRGLMHPSDRGSQ
jgi:transposase InsO family protein